MGLQGQPAIIVLMDQQQSETTQSSVHSRSELHQGQYCELEPWLSELGRFKSNALVFVFSFFFSFYGFILFLLDRVKYKTDWQLQPLSFKKWRRSYWISTVWISIIQKQLWKAEVFTHTFRATVFSVLVSKKSKHSPSAIHSLVSLSRFSVRTPLPEMELSEVWKHLPQMATLAVTLNSYVWQVLHLIFEEETLCFWGI